MLVQAYTIIVAAQLASSLSTPALLDRRCLVDRCKHVFTSQTASLRPDCHTYTTPHHTISHTTPHATHMQGELQRMSAILEVITNTAHDMVGLGDSGAQQQQHQPRQQPVISAGNNTPAGDDAADSIPHPQTAAPDVADIPPVDGDSPFARQTSPLSFTELNRSPSARKARALLADVARISVQQEEHLQRAESIAAQLGLPSPSHTLDSPQSSSVVALSRAHSLSPVKSHLSRTKSLVFAGVFSPGGGNAESCSDGGDGEMDDPPLLNLPSAGKWGSDEHAAAQPAGPIAAIDHAADTG